MNVRARPLIAVTLPPMTTTTAREHHPQRAVSLPRLRRLIGVIAALTLPVLGVAGADTVHRALAPKTTQAAAPANPSGGAAVPTGTATPRRAHRTMRTAARMAASRDMRS